MVAFHSRCVYKYNTPCVKSLQILLATSTARIDSVYGSSMGLVINYGEGGGYKMGKSTPPPSRQGKTCCTPPFQRVETFRAPPPYNMAKISSYLVKTTPKLVVSPPPFSAWLKLFASPPPLFRRGQTSHAPPPVL